MFMTTLPPSVRPIDILLIDDDDADVLLTRRLLNENQLHRSLTVAGDGWEALAMLRGEEGFKKIPRPDLIILDLNMPKLNGRETLTALKSDPNLKGIPVIVLSTSDAAKDVGDSYDLQASCFITKSLDLDEYRRSLSAIKDFWLATVRYCSK